MLSPQAEPGDLEMIEGTREVLGLLQGRWSVDVLYLLAGGTRRYNENDELDPNGTIVCRTGTVRYSIKKRIATRR